MKNLRSALHEDYFRSMMFGLQDGIVSTTGVVVGISIGVTDKAVIVLAAIVAVMVEASSMGAGQYSSEKAVHQMDKTGRHKDSLFLGAVIMFFAYLIGGMFPIIPTIIFDQPDARNAAIASSFVGLFVIGYLKGKIVEHRPWRSAIELFIIGAIATTVGVVVGSFLKV